MLKEAAQISALPPKLEEAARERETSKNAIIKLTTEIKTESSHLRLIRKNF